MSFYTKLNRAVISIQGIDAISFLQSLITNDIREVSKENSIYSLMLTPQGKYLYDFFIYYNGENNFLLDVNYSKLEEIIKKLNAYKLRSKVEITNLTSDFIVLSLEYNNLNKRFNIKKNLGNTIIYKNSFIVVDPRNINLNLRCLVSIQDFEELTNDYKENSELYDQLRIDHIIPEGDKDLIPEKSFPLEFQMDNLNAINFKKGCYIGQELTSRTKNLGVIRKKVVKIIGNSLLPSLGTDIYCQDDKLGIVCSSVGNQGLGLIRIENYQNCKNKTNISSGNCTIEKIEL